MRNHLSQSTHRFDIFPEWGGTSNEIVKLSHPSLLAEKLSVSAMYKNSGVWYLEQQGQQILKGPF